MRVVSTALATLIVIAGQSGCDAGCANEPILFQVSPSGAYKAVVFNRNCGATTGFNTQVSIIKSSEAEPDSGGNVLILDGKIPLSIQWYSDARVLINGTHGETAFKQERLVGEIEVAYE